MQYSYKNSTAAKTSVLANFQVLQNGNAIRIVDQDGSVYDGSLLTTEAKAESGNLNSIAQTDRIQNKTGGGGGFGGVGGVGGAGPSADSFQTAQYYFFQVIGTNQTLNQAVVFKGRLLANGIETRKVQQKPGAAAGPAHRTWTIAGQMKFDITNQAPQLSWPNLRISGTAIVNHTNHIDVNAAPVPPAKE
jgi:hypothetical protein